MFCLFTVLSIFVFCPLFAEVAKQTFILAIFDNCQTKCDARVTLLPILLFFSPVRHSPGGCRRWGWMVSDLHSSLLCTNSFSICIHEPLSLMSAVTLSIHLFRCLPLLRLPSIFVCSAFTGSLSVFILSTFQTIVAFSLVFCLLVSITA